MSTNLTDKLVEINRNGTPGNAGPGREERMRALSTRVDPGGTGFAANAAAQSRLVEELRRRLERVARGGAWSSSSASYLRAAERYWTSPAYRFIYIGFRCARTV